MPQTPHIEHHFTAGETVCDILVIYLGVAVIFP